MPIVNAKQMLEEIQASIIDPATEIARLKALIWGPKGTGKTVISVQLMKKLLKEFSPDKQKIVYIDTSEGWVSLKNHPGLLDNVIIIPFQSFEHIEIILMAIKRQKDMFEGVGGIIFDEFTLMVARDLRATMLRRDSTATVPEWPDYNEEAFRARRLIETIYSNNKLQLIAVGHDKDKKENGEVVFTFPNFNPAIGTEILRDMHLVAYMTAKVVKSIGSNEARYTREFQVHPTRLIEAKTRIGGLGIKVDTKTLVKKTIEWMHAGGEEKVGENSVEPEVAVPAEQETVEPALTDDDEPIKL